LFFILIQEKPVKTSSLIFFPRPYICAERSTKKQERVKKWGKPAFNGGQSCCFFLVIHIFYVCEKTKKIRRVQSVIINPSGDFSGLHFAAYKKHL
jgi:hypothetical protein